MAKTVGITGLVTSWGGTANTQLISGGNSPASFSLDISGEEADSTVLGASLVQAAYTKGMRSWSGSISAFKKTIGIGNAGSITFSAGYTTLLRSWDVTFEADSFESSVFGSSATTASWMEHTPGLIRVSGSFEAIVDDTTAIAMPANSSEPATLTLTIASGETFAFSAFTTRAAVQVATNQLNTVGYSFRGSGNVTVAASGDKMPFDAGSSIAIPVEGELVLQAATSRTYTGNAFWKRVNVKCSPAGLVTTDIGFQGTGALTPA